MGETGWFIVGVLVGVLLTMGFGLARYLMDDAFNWEGD